MMLQLRKDLGKVMNKIPSLLRLDHDVVNACFDDASYQLPEDTSHASLERSARVLEPEGHCLVTIHAEWSDE
jgi:hypothetical protein